MSTADLIPIEVAYALPDKARILLVKVPKDATIKEAIVLSGILDVFPGIVLNDDMKVGVFAKLKKLEDKGLRPHDRIEIYRPLTIDPMEARKIRAAKKK